MALIHDDVAVAGNEILDPVPSHQALEHGHVQLPVGSALAPSDLNRTGIPGGSIC